MRQIAREVNGPKRSRPEWIGREMDIPIKFEGATVDVGNESSANGSFTICKRGPAPSPMQLELDLISDPAINPSKTITHPVESVSAPVESVRASIERSVPSGNDAEAVLVRSYIERHMCSDKDLSFAAGIADSVRSVCKAEIAVIGCIGDGSASLKDSLKCHCFGILEGKRQERALFLDDLKAAGPSRGWTAKSSPDTANVIVLSPLGRRGTVVNLIVDSSLSQIWLERTDFSKLYVSLIEPRMCVSLCLLREWVIPQIPLNACRHALDYLLFSLLWRCLIENRVIPDLIGSSEYHEFDKRIWSGIAGTKEEVNELRYRWRIEGVGVARRASVKETIGKFIDFSRDALDPEQDNKANICPLNGLEIFDEGYACSPGRDKVMFSLWRAVCTPFTISNR